MREIKYICDSCGKELPKGEYPIILSATSYRETEVKKETLKVRQIDLCQHCHDELMSILSEAKTDGK